MTKAAGTAYRVKAFHPRRPGQPLRLTDKAGTLLAVSGELCDRVSPEHLDSFIRNGFVEPVADVKPQRAKAPAPAASEGED